jgi:sentrin-specific protease 7
MLVVLYRYLQYGKYQDKEAVLAKTHIFTTYFYKRLTTRPSSKNKANKHHPVEDDPSLSPAEKRYDRVRKWTKKVNLFDKDFIVVPINEHAHWFVCIICFPGEFFPICNVLL